MTQANEELGLRLAALRAEFAALGGRAAGAAGALTSTLPPPSALLDELAAARDAFADLRDAMLEEAGSLSLVLDAEGVASCRDLEPVLAAIQAAEERRARVAAWDEARESARVVLDRVLALIHREEKSFVPLAECQERAREMRAALSGPPPDDIEHETKMVPGRVRPFAELLSLVDGANVLDDDRCAYLQDSIIQSFGRPLALAALRGKLGREGDAPPRVPASRGRGRAAAPQVPAAPATEVAPAPEGMPPDEVDVTVEPAAASPNEPVLAPVPTEPPSGAPAPVAPPEPLHLEPTPPAERVAQAPTPAPVAPPPPVAPAPTAPPPVTPPAPPPPSPPVVSPAPPGSPPVVAIRHSADSIHVETVEARREREAHLERLALDGARWWIAARSGWNAMRQRGDTFGEAAREYLKTYPHLLAVPLQKSSELAGGHFAEGYALLLAHIEKEEEGFVKEALTRLNPQFTTGANDPSFPLGQELYLYVVAEGRLYKTYPDFVKEVVGHTLPKPGAWVQGGLVEGDDETQVFTRPETPGSSQEQSQTLTDAKQRFGPHVFAVTTGPLTARFFTLRLATPTLADPPNVEIKLRQDDAASDHAWLVLLAPGGKPQPPRKLRAGGTTLEELGKEFTGLWIAVFNADPSHDKRYELSISLRRPPPATPPPATKAAAAPTTSKFFGRKR